MRANTPELARLLSDFQVIVTSSANGLYVDVRCAHKQDIQVNIQNQKGLEETQSSINPV